MGYNYKTPLPSKLGCTHEWVITPATDGLEQECRKCNSWRHTPEEDKFWKKK